VGKAKRFGDEFLKLIKRHVEENDIDRPIDMVVKSVANKSKLKISIIQSIDRKVPLNDLAEGKGIEMNELLKELESIVYSGTRVNIDYYIDQVMDEEHRDDIFSYFKEEAESDDITTALMELGEDEFTEEEVRMVRIKFISEVGN
jgi:ATP-dependent DNA helicase RecQ